MDGMRGKILELGIEVFELHDPPLVSVAGFEPVPVLDGG